MNSRAARLLLYCTVLYYNYSTFGGNIFRIRACLGVQGVVGVVVELDPSYIEHVQDVQRKRRGLGQNARTPALASQGKL